MENISKTRRGRPLKVFADVDLRNDCARIFDNVKSYRSVSNRSYWTRAMTALDFGRNPEFLWLADAVRNRYRMTILSELGRIEDDETLLNAARVLCENKPRTAAAIAGIRRMRGVRKPPTVEGLREALLATVNRWFSQHQTGSWEQVREALALVQTDIEASAAKSQP